MTDGRINAQHIMRDILCTTVVTCDARSHGGNARNLCAFQLSSFKQLPNLHEFHFLRRRENNIRLATSHDIINSLFSALHIPVRSSHVLI